MVTHRTHPAAPLKPRWLVALALMVITSVGLGAVITYQVVSRKADKRLEREDEEQRQTRRKEKKEACLFERCKDITWKPGADVEALDWLDESTSLARSLESKAELVMITMTDTVNGRRTKDGNFAMSLLYRFPNTDRGPGHWLGLQVIVNERQMLLKRSPDVGLPPAPTPHCNTQGALRVAFANGIVKERPATVLYDASPASVPPKWTVTQTEPDQTTHVVYVRGVDCAVFSPY
jgi:hypothetical protein